MIETLTQTPTRSQSHGLRESDGIGTPAPHRVVTWSWNRRVAWVGFCLGVVSGLGFGLWSFDGPVAPPPGFEVYEQTSRRLARLGHIAFFGLGFLHLLMIREVPRLALGRQGHRVAAFTMNLGNLGLPLALLAAGWNPNLKYVLPIPALSVLVAVQLVTIGVWKASPQDETSGS